MRIPYIVGRWVNDRHHYGRHRLFAYLLDTPSAALWLVGARRIGKTSLLRQLEFLAHTTASGYVPLFWDMQGCENSGDLSVELYMALEDTEHYFGQYGIDVSALQGQDALVILRRLTRALNAAGKRLLLLIDEAEALLAIARTEPAWLARLRRALQVPNQKCVLASTKLLAQLNDLTADWPTSPFLFGFNLINLWSLDPDSAVALIEQRQAAVQVTVSPEILEDIIIHTNRHPYLLQFLCHRLYGELEDGTGYLRAPTNDDLDFDNLLAGLFLVDFQHLTNLERRLLLTIGRSSIATEAEVLTALADQSPERILTFLWGLEKLGHLRQVYGQWTIGNEYLRRWLQQELDTLERMNDAKLADDTFEKLLKVGHAQEVQGFRTEIKRLELAYSSIKADLAQSQNGQREALRADLDHIETLLMSARRDLNRSFLSRHQPSQVFSMT